MVSNIKYFERASNGTIPAESKAVGHEASGEALYAAIASYKGGVHPGKVRKGFGGCNIGWGGKEVCVRSYDVLIADGKWVKASSGSVPNNAFEAGNEASGEIIYLARCDFEGGIHIGKVRRGFGGCNIGWGGREHSIREYEVFVLNSKDIQPSIASGESHVENIMKNFVIAKCANFLSEAFYIENNSVMHIWQKTADKRDHWSQPDFLFGLGSDGGTNTKLDGAEQVSACTNNTGNIEVVARTQDNKYHLCYHDGNTWQGWFPINQS